MALTSSPPAVVAYSEFSGYPSPAVVVASSPAHSGFPSPAPPTPILPLALVSPDRRPTKSSMSTSGSMHATPYSSAGGGRLRRESGGGTVATAALGTRSSRRRGSASGATYVDYPVSPTLITARSSQPLPVGMAGSQPQWTISPLFASSVGSTPLPHAGGVPLGSSFAPAPAGAGQGAVSPDFSSYGMRRRSSNNALPATLVAISDFLALTANATHDSYSVSISGAAAVPVPSVTGAAAMGSAASQGLGSIAGIPVTVQTPLGFSLPSYGSQGPTAPFPTGNSSSTGGGQHRRTPNRPTLPLCADSAFIVQRCPWTPPQPSKEPHGPRDRDREYHQSSCAGVGGGGQGHEPGCKAGASGTCVSPKPSRTLTWSEPSFEGGTWGPAAGGRAASAPASPAGSLPGDAKSSGSGAAAGKAAAPFAALRRRLSAAFACASLLPSDV
ncbi:hypothetical protein HYH03_009820 [Edaphochlamys debaryana]|uniref:Uncharacterized protein n=1 Tax=Edaphochlamys debaryana TaxID=47281 RepID=A0A835XVF1_9CHLO|nr:hypothetical protein HYH03_009820 [Edaphochlamys debaryana]|eukprot:KAG2491867.1 hypothetical protein HYH03_009820 [Edaphochlamys debaryana]